MINISILGQLREKNYLLIVWEQKEKHQNTIERYDDSIAYWIITGAQKLLHHFETS